MTGDDAPEMLDWTVNNTDKTVEAFTDIKDSEYWERGEDLVLMYGTRGDLATQLAS